MMSREEVFAALKKRGATRAVIEYEGGDDEGAAEGVILYDGDEEIGELHERDPEYERDENGNIVYYLEPGAKYERPKRITLSPEKQAESDLAGALVKPVYDQYGGFDGGFEVRGRLVWDVTNGTLEMSGDETVTECFAWEI